MAEDLSVFFNDPLLTVPVVCGAVTTTGMKDESDELVADSMVQSTEYAVLVRDSLFPVPPVNGDSITVDGVNYTVNNYSKIDDGKLARISLSKV